MAVFQGVSCCKRAVRVAFRNGEFDLGNGGVGFSGQLVRQELAQEGAEGGGILVADANQVGGFAEMHEGFQYGGAHLGRELVAAAGAATTGFVSLGQGPPT